MKTRRTKRILTVAGILCISCVAWVLLAKWHQEPFGRIQAGSPIPAGDIQPQLLIHENLALLLSPKRELFIWGGISEHSATLQNWTGHPGPIEIPIPVPTQGNIQKLAAYQGYLVALMRDGSIQQWTRQSSITNIAPSMAPSSGRFIDISAGMTHVVALNEDGTLWAWGQNDWDQLGQGHRRKQQQTYPKQSRLPIQVGRDTDWKYVRTLISQTYAIKEDGSMWRWGRPPFTSPRMGHPGETPRRITDRTGWKKVAPSYGSALCLRADGTLWIHRVDPGATPYWGEGMELGPDGFGQVGSDTDWKHILSSQIHMLAQKQDGSWWGLGSNQMGQLGLDPDQSKDGLISQWSPLPDAFEPWAMALGTRSTLVLTQDGTLWNAGMIHGRPYKPSKWDELAQILNRNNPAGRHFHFPISTPDFHRGFHRIWGWPPKPEESFYLETQ